MLLQRLQTLANSEIVLRVQAALGVPVYIVGGAVRDLALGQECHDLDLASALPAAVAKEKLEGVGLRVIDTGIEHGTVTVLLGDDHAELTTFRMPSKRSASRFSKSIEDDLSGRDFTINAVAYADGQLYDPFGGLEDLSQKKLRTVGEAEERFDEDPLRILRMVRFGSAAGFEIDKAALDAATKLGVKLKDVSPERIKDELSKILVSDEPVAAFETMRQCELFQYFIPEIIPAIGFEQNEFHIHDVYGHTLDVIERTPANLTLRLTALFHDLGKPATFSLGEDGRRHFYCHEQVSVQICKEVMQRLKYSNAEIQRVSLLVAEHMRPVNCGPAGVRRLFRDLGDAFDEWLLFKYADMPPAMSNDEFERLMSGFKELVAEERQKMQLPEYGKLALDGNDIISLGIKAGPVVGQILKQLEERVIENPSLNTKEQLLEVVQKIIKAERA